MVLRLRPLATEDESAFMAGHRAMREEGFSFALRYEPDMTWNEFYDRVHRAAAFFRDLGIQKGDRVAVWMLNCHEYLELYYATAIAGIVIVPLTLGPPTLMRQLRSPTNRSSDTSRNARPR